MFPEQTVYHWENVPEDVLTDCGFIRNKTNLRQKRKRYFEETGKYFNYVQEYGLDGISIEEISDSDSDSSSFYYYGIQCKCYHPDHYLCGHHLGTFYQSLLPQRYGGLLLHGHHVQLTSV